MKMLNFFKITYLIMLTTAMIASCKSNSKTKEVVAKECISLNNQGVKYLIENNSIDKKSRIANAIMLFKQAIKCDSTYLNAYINLVNAYDQCGNYDNELSTLNESLKLTHSSPSILTLKVKLFLKISKPDSADSVFQLANKSFEQRLVQHHDNISAIDRLILLKAIMYGKEEALKELDKQINLHPQISTQLASEHDFYRDFDRVSFINGTVDTSLGR